MNPLTDLSNQPGQELLDQLLSDRNQYPDRMAAIDAQIHSLFARKVAVLALDMCGFSRLTEAFGIIHYLAMIHQMEAAARPAVKGNGGVVIKREADNLWAIFETPAKALEASFDIFRAFDAINTVVPEHRDILGSVGIGYGELLLIGDDDLYGSEMNLASKLGEDLAEAKQILLTPAAYEALPPNRYLCAPEQHAISGLTLDCYLFKEKIHSHKPG